MLVESSKDKWKEENIRNDGLVDSFASIIPRENVEFVLLPNLDHGALVLKPSVAGISAGHHYDQMPFVRTLFKRLSSRMKEIQAAQTVNIEVTFAARGAYRKNRTAGPIRSCRFYVRQLLAASVNFLSGCFL